MRPFQILDPLPTWFTEAPADALFSCQQVADLFKYKSTAVVHTAIKKERLPRPDVPVKKTHRTPLFWAKTTILQEIAKREETNMKNHAPKEQPVEEATEKEQDVNTDNPSVEYDMDKVFNDFKIDWDSKGMGEK